MVDDLKKYLEHNPGALNSEKVLRGLLDDALSHDQQKIDLMMNAYSAGFVEKIRRNYPPDTSLIEKFVKKFARLYKMSTNQAYIAVEYWLDALNLDILRQSGTVSENRVLDIECPGTDYLTLDNEVYVSTSFKQKPTAQKYSQDDLLIRRQKSRKL